MCQQTNHVLKTYYQLRYYGLVEKKNTFTFYNLNRKADKLKFKTCDWFNESQKKSKMSKFSLGSLESRKKI